MYYVLSFIGGGFTTLVILFVLAKVKMKKIEKVRKEAK